MKTHLLKPAREFRGSQRCGKGRLKRDMITDCKYLPGSTIHEGLKLLAASENGRSTCNVLELRKKKLGPDNHKSL